MRDSRVTDLVWRKNIRGILVSEHPGPFWIVKILHEHPDNTFLKILYRYVKRCQTILRKERQMKGQTNVDHDEVLSLYRSPGL